MGIKNYLVEGVSGSGKTTVAEELERRNYHVVHGDRILARMGDPGTGKPFTNQTPDEVADSPAWKHEHWIWDEDKVRLLISDKSNPVTFFCGGSRNLPRFINLFAQIFILDIDAETLKERLRGRPTDEFGGKPDEQELILRLHAAMQDLPNSGIAIDATRPVKQIVDEILERCAEADDSRNQ
jgi:adenylate kinase family enzyme